MSTAEKIHRFALYVQGEPMKVNAIQTIENAITGSKLNLKTQYEVSRYYCLDFILENMDF